MSQVIIFTNENGNVSVCHPSGQIPIEDVLVKDCPAGATIVDESILPEDHTYFNAWRLVGGSVVVDEAAAQQIAIDNLNRWARDEYLKRAADEAIGIQSMLSGEDFAAVIEEGRQKIAASTSTSQMSAIVADTEEKAKTAPLE